jgi:hypothetical protein
MSHACEFFLMPLTSELKTAERNLANEELAGPCDHTIFRWPTPYFTLRFWRIIIAVSFQGFWGHKSKTSEPPQLCSFPLVVRRIVVYHIWPFTAFHLLFIVHCLGQVNSDLRLHRIWQIHHLLCRFASSLNKGEAPETL